MYTRATRLLGKRYWFCPAFNLFSLITPRSSIALADERGESLKSHPHANTNILFTSADALAERQRTVVNVICWSRMKRRWWKISSDDLNRLLLKPLSLRPMCCLRSFSGSVLLTTGLNWFKFVQLDFHPLQSCLYRPVFSAVRSYSVFILEPGH